MKKGGLARALQVRKTLDDKPASAEKPGPRRQEAPVPAAVPKAKTKSRRFHTTFYPDSKEFYDEIKIALIREGNGRDFNRLVNDLLAAWLEAPGH